MRDLMVLCRSCGHERCVHGPDTQTCLKTMWQDEENKERGTEFQCPCGKFKEPHGRTQSKETVSAAAGNREGT